MKKITLNFCFIMLFGIVKNTAQDNTQNIIYLNSPISYNLLESNQNLDKLGIFLKAQQDQTILSNRIYLGASLTGILDYQHSNTESKFGYLMRHPTANNQRTQDVSEAVIHSAQIALYGAVNSWISIFSELLYNPEQSFGQGTITSLERNQVQLRKAFILFSNPNKSPLYLALGKMDGNFGQTGSVNPFSNSTMWHSFGVLAYGARIGYSKSGLNASLMLIQGGAQFRAANVPVDGTNIPSKLNNYSADINYTFSLGSNSTLKLGGSYLNGSAYCQPWPIQHFMPCEETNPAYSFYGSLNFGNLNIMGSFASTLDPWPGTFNPSPPLDIYEASKVSSLSYGAKYELASSGSVVYSLSAEFSNFIAGPDDAPWHRQNQIIIGLESEINKSSRLFVEAFQTNGFAPLNFISGGNLPDPGQTHSDGDASSLGIVVGGMISF